MQESLIHIEDARASDEDVHVVTQLVVSLLGLIVFPWEAHADSAIRSTRLTVLEDEGWPVWKESKISKGLGELTHRLRNAVAHRHIVFSSDARSLDEVTITFTSRDGDWEASIAADELRAFCYRFIELVECSMN